MADAHPLVRRVDESAAAERAGIGHDLCDGVERNPVSRQAVGIDEHLVLGVALAPDRDVRDPGDGPKTWADGPESQLRQFALGEGFRGHADLEQTAG